ncbi:sulfatase-like hydrolase/transferase [Bacteroidales bacterium OttesenSCG-928-C19]|nr:sulfatase-like hydrolase/transferase [Bacteroidales bacterium OttesenSCG-928-C19]
MKSFCKYLLWLLLFLFFMFFVQRNVFLYSNISSLLAIDWKDALLTNWYALRMDTAAICYIMLLPLILFICWFIKPKRWINTTLNVYFLIIIVATSLITIVDNGLFRAWGVKITPKAIMYLDNPKEALESTKSSPLFLLITLFIIQTALLVWIYLRFISKNLKKEGKYPLVFSIAFPVLFLGLLFIGARGGLQSWPINARVAYFSKQPLMNLSSVNSFWNFLDVLRTKEDLQENPYSYFDDNEMNRIVNDLYAVQDSTTFILTTERPNIVLILLESYSGEAVGVLNPEQQVSATPFIDHLSKDGLLFTNFYATGFRTEHGQVALLSGIPAQPRTSISRVRSKIQRLPLLIRNLSTAGYHTSYITGGDIDFTNTQFLLRFGGCNEVLGDKDMMPYKRKATWGVYDDEMFAFALENINKYPEPFFSIVATTTNHEPFEADVENKFGNKNIEEKYMNTVYYTDQCIETFFEEAKKESWFDNTLFIFVADHAHYLPNNQPAYAQERHWIPCMFYGKVLKDEFKGKTIDKVASQSDFPKTLLTQLNIEHPEYSWGKNILNSNQVPFAFYTFDEGFGLINNEQTIIYDCRLEDVIYVKDTALFKQDSSILQQGKALLQKEMDDFIGL